MGSKGLHGNLDTRIMSSADAFLWSTIGANIAWERYITLPTPGSQNYEFLIQAALHDESGIIAQCLFHIGVLNERRIWPKLQKETVYQLSNEHFCYAILLSPIPAIYAAPERKDFRGRSSLNSKFVSDYLHHCYVATPIEIPNDPINGVVIEAFITKYIDQLTVSELFPEAGHTLMNLFERLLEQSPSEAQELLRQFYLEPKYPYGIHQLTKRRSLFPMVPGKIYLKEEMEATLFSGKERTTYSISNTYQLPFIHFLLKSQPKYLSLGGVYRCLDKNFLLGYDRWPVNYSFNYFNIPLDSLRNVMQVLSQLKTTYPPLKGKDPNRGECLGRNYIHSSIEHIYKKVLNTLVNIDLFTHDTYQLLKEAGAYDFRTAALSLWENKWVIAQLHQPVVEISLNSEELAYMYQGCDRAVTWRNNDDRERFSGIMLAHLEEATPTDQLEALETLLFGLTPLSDIPLTQKLIAHWSKLKAEALGVDDKSDAYYQKTSTQCKELIAKCPSLYAADLMESLSRNIQAQKNLCAFIDNALNPPAKDENIWDTSDKKSALIKLTQKLANKGLANPAVEFLTFELTRDSLEHFLKALGHQNFGVFDKNDSFFDRISPDQARIQAITFYHTFWSRTLEERAVGINHLLIPSSKMGKAEDEQQAYDEAYKFVTSVLFPKDDKESDMAKALLQSFLAVGHPHVRSYLLTSVISANKAVKGGEKNITAVLPKLAEAMGAAGVKAGQAAHSYPKTPADMRASLAYLKSQTRLPYRWELMKLIHKTVPAEVVAQIKRVNSLLGGASFYLAIEVEMNDGSIRVLRLMRDNAAKEAERGFDHLKAMLAHCTHPSIRGIQQDLQHIIAEAKAGAAVEIDTPSVAQQYALAETLYAQQKHQISTDGQSFTVCIEPVHLFAHGEGFQLISKAEGIEFNELKKDPTKTSLCKAIALALCKTELTNLLGSGHCDIDRHGAQSRIQYEETAPNQFKVLITHYDFGELSPVLPTKAQLHHCQQFIQEALAGAFSPWKLMADFMSGAPQPSIIDGLAEKLMDYIRTHSKEGERSKDPKQDDLSRLRGLFKGLLALNDYLEVLAQDKTLLMQLLPVIQNAVTSKAEQNVNSLASLFSLFANPKRKEIEGEQPAIKKQHEEDDDVKMMYAG